MMVKQAASKFVRVVKRVRWEQFTQQLFVDYACIFNFCRLKENESRLNFLFGFSNERAIDYIILTPKSSSESCTNVDLSFKNSLISEFNIVLTEILK